MDSYVEVHTVKYLLLKKTVLRHITITQMIISLVTVDGLTVNMLVTVVGKSVTLDVIQTVCVIIANHQPTLETLKQDQRIQKFCIS